MPFTPFHFGPGALLHAAAPRHVSFLAFCAANVVIDFESLYNLLSHREPVHAFLHTYLGATLVIAAVGVLFMSCRCFAARFPLPNLFRWHELTGTQVFIGATLGAYSHVVLDSVMHADTQPLLPFGTGNALLGLVPLDALHLACLASGALGLLAMATRRLIAGGKAADGIERMR